MNSEYAFTVESLGELDATSFVPLYMQLADRVAARIREHGGLAVGKVLPSEAECVQRLRVSRPTVRQAMSHLLAQGLILREKGRGTFVAPLKLEHDVSHGFEDDMHAAHRRVEYRLLAWDKIDAPPQIASVLGRRASDPLFLLRRLRIVEGQAIGLEERYLPEEWGREISPAQIESAPVVDLLQRLSRQKVVRLDMEVSSALAGKDLARLFQVSASAPLLLRKTTFVVQSGDALMHGTVTFLAEHYKFNLSINYTARARGFAA